MTRPAYQMYSTRSAVFFLLAAFSGEQRTLESPISLDELVQLLDLKGKRLAIEVNQEIVPRGQFDTFQLSENDSVEIFHAIGGG